MSNDVQLARVSKIKRSTDIKSKSEMVNNRRITKGTAQESQHPNEFVFENISAAQHLSEIESPDHTQRGDTNESDNNISSCSTLDIVNKVENLSLHQLEIQVRELTQRLQQAEELRTKMQLQLDECNAEKELCFRRLDVVSAAHECRITEMHCVIAELSKKLRAKQEITILEEQEPEGSEISFQEGSIYNSELNLTNPDAECQTDPLDGGDYSAGEGFGSGGDNFGVFGSTELKMNDTLSKVQVEALQEEVLHLKAQIALLQSEIANSLRLEDHDAVEKQQSFPFCGDDIEENASNCSLEHLHVSQKNEELKMNNFATTKEDSEFMSPQKVPPILKMAERVKLRCASKCGLESVAAPDLCSSIHLGPNTQHNNAVLDSFQDSAQLNNELQRLQRKVEHLKVRNTMLFLTLDECKEHCEHLYLLCGKYESNAIALQSAVNYSDRAIEAYDVMLALLESKLALMKDESPAAKESRKAVETVARHLLDRLESEKNTNEHSLGPWQNTFNIPDKAYAPWTSEDDNRLRYHVSKLKGRRSTVQNTIVNLESPFSDFYEKSRLVFENGKKLHSQEKVTHLDLEIAVMMQELLTLREENIGLKSKTEEAERERQYAMDKIGTLQEALKQLQLQLQLTADSNALFHQDRNKENRVSYTETEHVALTEQQLVEALTRESELKGRIQILIASVSASHKASEEKYEQLHNTVRELQKSNLNLTQMLEQNKRKYQARIRKLEQKTMEISLDVGRQTGSDSVVQEQPPHRFKLKSVTTKPPQHENVPETTL